MYVKCYTTVATYEKETPVFCLVWSLFGFLLFPTLWNLASAKDAAPLDWKKRNEEKKRKKPIPAVRKIVEIVDFAFVAAPVLSKQQTNLFICTVPYLLAPLPRNEQRKQTLVQPDRKET